MDKIGIVTITFNSTDVLQSFLDCIWRQTHQNLVLYVIDNNSTDDTICILEKSTDSRLVIIKNHQNVGVAKANNQGIIQALEDNCNQILIINATKIRWKLMF